MLPPVDGDTLIANPKFDALYRDLCNNKLEPDGTTRVDGKTQREREAFGEELKKARTAASKQDLVKTYLQSLAYRGDELPVELRELVAIIGAALHTPLSRGDALLLREDVDKFKDNIMLISLVVSKAAAEDITQLARILSTEATSDWRDLPSRIQRIKDNGISSEAAIADLRIQIAHETTNVHSLYRQAIETSIRILEQTIHGSVSRSTKAKADYLATVAEGMARKLKLQQNSLLAQTKSPDLQEALRRRVEDLDGEAVGLKRRMRELQEKLEEYRANAAVQGMAREYAEIVSETVKTAIMGETDLEKLRDALDGRAIARAVRLTGFSVTSRRSSGINIAGLANAIRACQQEEAGGNFASAWLETLEIIEAERTSKSTSRIVYRFPVLQQYLNPTQTLHGGAVATIFDIATSWLLYLVCEPGFWTSMGTTRTLNCTYLRPAMEDEGLRLECEIIHCGKRMALLKGTLLRESDRAVIATCEHNKFNVDAESKV
ncbi:hypothetical protein CBER1_05128 [Lecanosticta acicola]|uniref:Thioesterase domain-containing protein n=1 Tax=Lecanosticta acicola TaxID=111012 RepID=A0AAI8Z917_9PEZI|nr:hypothetical protein CBER1_05128 [Lecanosticta acicola]